MATKPQKPAPLIGKAVPRPRSFAKDDFPFIRKASIEFGITFFLCAALVIGSGLFLSSQQNKLNATQAKRNQTFSTFTEAEKEKREIQDFQPKYAQLVKRGFVGEERRLDWVEGMKHIQENRKLLPITYEISPQQPMQVDPSVATGELELRASKMELHLNLLHEMDMLNFLQDLKSTGQFSVQSCIIKPTGLTASLASHLTADCRLYWLTMGARVVPGAEAGAAAEGTAPSAAAAAPPPAR